jgi:succinate dehydrogenase hydrophobic anchor subunit
MRQETLLAPKQAQSAASSTALSPQYAYVQCRSQWVKFWSQTFVATLYLHTTGLRVTQFERKKKLQFAWWLSHIQTVVAMMLVISGAILVYGLNLTTYKECRASITVCLFLYFSSKILL